MYRLLFFIFTAFAFCGYFSEQENDIAFFLTVGGMLSVYGMLATFKGHLFMENQKTVFVSIFAMVGLYKRLEFEKVTKVDVQGKYWEICNKKQIKLCLEYIWILIQNMDKQK